MVEQVGTAIKEARLAAGMTQAQLAEAAGNISARDISKVERGLKEPTDDELAAIAKATGADPESLLGTAADDAPTASAEATETPIVADEDILELLNAADPAVKKAALSVLKGETQQKYDILGSILPIITEVMSSKETGSNPIATIIGFLGSEEGAAFLGTIKGALGNLTGMLGESGLLGENGLLGGIGANGKEGQSARKTSDSFLAFTFFYTVAIYVLLIGFHYVQGLTDKKSEKPEEPED